MVESSFVCVKCGATLSTQNGAVDFINGASEKRPREVGHSKEEVFYFNNTMKAKFYEIGKKIISCDYVVNDYLKEFLGFIEKDAIVVELGSGNRRCKEDIINVDIFPFPNVDVLSDIKKTPFGDNTVDYIINDAVLEHVPEPQTVWKEKIAKKSMITQKSRKIPRTAFYYLLRKHRVTFKELVFKK